MEEQFKTLIVLSHYLEVCFLLCFLAHICYASSMNTPYPLCLQTGRFRQFWDEAAKSRHIVEAVPGSNEF
jgi:translation initiation factor 3 subunit K